MLNKWLNQLDEKVGGNKKQKSRFRMLWAMGLIGVMILLVTTFFDHRNPIQSGQTTPIMSNQEDEPPHPQTTPISNKIDTYEKQYEADLSEILGQIVGVDDVSVVVNLDSTEEDVIKVDEHNSEQVTTETDTKGGNRSVRQESDDRKPTFYQDKEGEKPLVVKKLKPKVRGILVVASGVENLQVKAAVIEAIQRTLDVPVHRISVLPKG